MDCQRGPSEPAVKQYSAVPACTVLDKTIKINRVGWMFTMVLASNDITDKMT